MTTDASNTTEGSETPPRKRWSKLDWLLLVFVMLFAIGTRWNTINRVFERDPEGCGAFYGQLARNYHRFPILKTLAVPVQNLGYASTDNPVCYPNHPPLLPLLIAGTYTLFGWNAFGGDVPPDWQTRLSTTLCTLACVAMIFVLIRNRAGPRAATIAAFLFSAVPMTLYFGSQPDVINTQLCFFAMLTTVAYLRLHARPTIMNFALLCFAFAPAAASDWPAFHLVVVLGVHFVFTQPSRRWPWIIAFGAVCAILFFLLYAQVATVVHDWGWMGRLVKRRALSSEADSRERITAINWIRGALLGHGMSRHTPIVFALVVTWIALAATTLQRHRATPLVALLLAWAGVHIIVGRQGVYVHEWWWWPLTPAAVMASGVALDSLMQRIEALRVRAAVTNVACAVLLIALAAWNIRTVDRQLAHPFTITPDAALNYSLPEIGVAIRDAAPPNRAVLLAESDDTLGLWLYADRPIKRHVWGRDDLKHRWTDGVADLPFGVYEPWHEAPAALLVPKAYVSEKLQPLLDYCKPRYPMRESAKFITFDLTRSN